MSKRFFAFVFLALAMMGGAALAGDRMTNSDVIALVKAKMSADSIVMAVNNATPAFDTSTKGLLALNKAGVPDAVIQAILATGGSAPSAHAGSGHGSAGKSSGNAAALNDLSNPENVVLVDGTKQSALHYLVPQTRTAARALGFGGMATYAVLMGDKAMLRLTNTQPSFLIAVPNNSQPQSYFTLANFAVRRNASREVLIGGGAYMSYSTGVAKDRVVATTYEKYGNQAHAPKNYTIYKVSVVAPMAKGEYAMILYNSQVRVSGFFASGSDSYFDFGID